MAYPFNFPIPADRLIAHRGWSSKFPENTLLSINEAAKAGFKAIEIDVQLTADNQLVVFHDFSGDRLAGESEHISNLTLAELKKWNVAKNQPKHGPQSMPSLQEVMLIALEHDLAINIEIKAKPEHASTVAQLLVACIDECWVGGREQLLVSSFNHDVLREFRELAPDISIGYLVNHAEKADIYKAINTENSSLHVRAGHILPGTIERLKSTLPIFCFTVNEPYQAQMLLESGVSALFTDYPDNMHSFLN